MYTVPSSHPNQQYSAVSRNRNRGVVLSERGWQKLIQAGAIYDQVGNRYTYENLSERSLLNERTISRLLSCEARVDKRSLKIFFAAFDLQLDSGDYTTTNGYSTHHPTLDSSRDRNSILHINEAELSYQELIELYQRLVQDLRRLSHLLNLDEMSGGIPLKATELN
ncbi:MAG TPA: hypothetical protein V6C78_30575 [Crinalium sp.]